MQAKTLADLARRLKLARVIHLRARLQAKDLADLARRSKLARVIPQSAVTDDFSETVLVATPASGRRPPGEPADECERGTDR